MKPPLVIVGEAYGEADDRLKLPFVGPSGAALLRMMNESKLLPLNKIDQQCIHRYYETEDPTWIAKVWKAHRHDIYCTNVFNLRPINNDIESLCGPRAGGIAGYPAIVGSKYPRAEFESELERLANEILDINPNLILCLGNIPLWALGGRTRH